MQKLELIKKCQKGSALVGVVAFSLVMTIASASFIMLASSGVNDEVEAHLNELAFQAAESGLLLGTRYLRKKGNWQPSGTTTIKSNWNYNGFNVNITTMDSLSHTWVVSEASNSKLPYKKRLKWMLEKKDLGEGTYINNLYVSSRSTVGGGYFDNVVIDGPMHSNSPIVVSSVSKNVRFMNGQVEAHNMLGNYQFDWDEPSKQMTYEEGKSEAWGNYGDGRINNYDYGIYVHSEQQGTDEGADIDVHMTDVFLHSQDSLYVDDYYAPDITLDSSYADLNDVNDESIARRPTIEFKSDGSALYYTWGYDGSNWSVNKDSLTAAQIKGNLLRVPASDVNVLGVVNGDISVMTDSGYSIHAVGNLKYNDFDKSQFGNWDASTPEDGWNNSTNYGIPTNSDDIVGLISGHDLYFGTEWFDPRDKLRKDVVGDADDGKLYFMANAVAAYSGGTNMWKIKNKKIDPNAYKNYDLRFVGGRTMDMWFNYTSGGGKNFGAIRFYYDTRLSGLVNAPKMPEVYAADVTPDDLFKFNLTNWTEENIDI
ncbi:MAG: hypothetical protein HQK83_07945 [Fibrobacteria bacterium]|nr:hypothetical protein [Fibrobacteria bacterium]